MKPVFVPHSINRYRPPIYISGPMTGVKDFNHPLFNEVAVMLRADGWRVINPAEALNGSTDLPRHRYLAVDVVELVVYARAILLLPGWLESDGAKLEAQIGVDRCYDFFTLGLHGALQSRSRQDVKEVLAGE